MSRNKKNDNDPRHSLPGHSHVIPHTKVEQPSSVRSLALVAKNLEHHDNMNMSSNQEEHYHRDKIIVAGVSNSTGLHLQAQVVGGRSLRIVTRSNEPSSANIALDRAQLESEESNARGTQVMKAEEEGRHDLLRMREEAEGEMAAGEMGQKDREDGPKEEEVKEENGGKKEQMEAPASWTLCFDRNADKKRIERKNDLSKQQKGTAGGGGPLGKFDGEPPGELREVDPESQKTFATTLKFTIIYQGTVRHYSIYAENVHKEDQYQDPNKNFQYHSEELIVHHLVNLVKKYSRVIHKGGTPPSSEKSTGDTRPNLARHADRPVVSFLSWEEHPVRLKIKSKPELCPGCMADYTKLLSTLEECRALQASHSQVFRLQENTHLTFGDGVKPYTAPAPELASQPAGAKKGKQTKKGKHNKPKS